MLLYTLMSLDVANNSVPALTELDLTTHRGLDEFGTINYRSELPEGLGFLKAAMDPTTDIFSIDYVYAAMPRQGHGKLLIRKALELATDAEAELIDATIVRRECVESMKKVFGETAVRVAKLGDYESLNTLAFLNYYL
jgi:hypothetical protein